MDEIKEINFKDISTSFDKLNIESPNKHTESVLNKADLLEDLESVKSIEVEIKDNTIVQRFEEKPENKNGINMNNAVRITI